jgi:F-type H+-transporting ATPase subunit epsilon
MHVTVVSPVQAVFDGVADAVVAPAYDGLVGVLPRHAAFLTLLGIGTLTLRQGATTTRLQVSGGFLQVVQGGDTVRIVADRVDQS